MIKRICENCDFWQKMEGDNGGICKRYPPKPTPMPIQMAGRIVVGQRPAPVNFMDIILVIIIAASLAYTLGYRLGRRRGRFESRMKEYRRGYQAGYDRSTKECYNMFYLEYESLLKGAGEPGVIPGPKIVP